MIAPATDETSPVLSSVVRCCLLGLGFSLLVACSVSETTVENCFSSSVTQLPEGLHGLSGLSSIKSGRSIYLWTTDEPSEDSISQASSVHLLRFREVEGEGTIEHLSEIELNTNAHFAEPGLVPLLVDESTIYFTLPDVDSGSELWSWPVDGSDIPRRLFDFFPGARGSNIEWMHKVGDRYFLSAESERSNGYEMHVWSGDPNVLPVLVKDLFNGTLGSRPDLPLVAGDHLWFTAWTASSGREWWRYPVDGSSEPMMILELNPGSGSTLNDLSGLPVSSAVHRGRIYFGARDADMTERRLWSVDPDDLATLAEFSGTTASGSVLRDPNQFISTNEGLYFVAGVDRLMRLTLNDEVEDLVQILGASDASSMIKVGETFYYHDRVISTGFLAGSSNAIEAFTLGDDRGRDAVRYPGLSGYEGGGLHELSGKLTVVEEDGVRLIERRDQCR